MHKSNGPDLCADVTEIFPRSSDNRKIVDVQPISLTFGDVQSRPLTSTRNTAIESLKDKPVHWRKMIIWKSSQGVDDPSELVTKPCQ